MPLFVPPPVVTWQSGIPIIIASSGSMGNNGALTGLTAVSMIHPNAYIYLPAAAIVAGSAAGFYYAVFSSTTAATVYNNTYTPGTPPTIPASPTAFVTTGPGAFAGSTAEITLATFTIPAGMMGPNGEFEGNPLVTNNNSGGNKVIFIKFGGTSFYGQTFTTTTTAQIYARYGNSGVTGAQKGHVSNSIGLSANTAAMITSSVDTTAAVDVIITGQHSTATDTVTLESYLFKLWPKA